MQFADSVSNCTLDLIEHLSICQNQIPKDKESQMIFRLLRSTSQNSFIFHKSSAILKGGFYLFEHSFDLRKKNGKFELDYKNI